MPEKNSQILEYDSEESLLLLEFMLNENFKLQLYRSEKIIYGFDHHNEKAFEYKLPLVFPVFGEEDTLSAYYKRLQDKLPDYLIILMQAGTCALGYFEETKLDSHKVIRKYMVRAKQGKAQIKHLTNKGKSKAGSRVRLAQTKDFFEEINEKLLEWEVENVHSIVYSAGISLWNLMFEAKTLPPFEKKDKRLLKIPKDIQNPSYEELLEINRFISTSSLTLYKEINLDFL